MKNLLITQLFVNLPLKPLLLLSLSVVPLACQSTDLYRYDRQIIDAGIEGAYALALADIDGDGLVDIVAATNDPAQLIWYQNPSWSKHYVASMTRANTAAAPYDIDGDGDTDLVLASAFDIDAGAQEGLLQWYENPGNPREVQQWDAHIIDRPATPHRLQWIDVVGNGRKVLVTLAVNDGQLLAYPIPRNPTMRWQSITLAAPLQGAQDLSVTDINDDSRDELLIASASGVELLRFATEEQSVLISRIAAADEGEKPITGSLQAALGSLTNRRQFIASIESQNGNEVVVYTPININEMTWERVVIDGNVQAAHALTLVDINNDGVDEIVVGGDAIYTYRFNTQVEQWQRETLSQISASTAGIEAGDINADGRKDIIVIGSGNTGVFLLRSAP